MYLNYFCDQALLKGYQDSTLAINAEIVNACPAAKVLPQAAVEEDKVESPLEDTLKFEGPDQDATPADAPQTNEPLQMNLYLILRKLAF